MREGILAGWASTAQTSCRSMSLHKFSQHTVVATEAYFGLGLRGLVERRIGWTCSVSGSGSGGVGSSRSTM